jgi:AraC-like DNA-binding protein
MQYSSDIKKSESQQFISINNCGELRVNSDSHIRRYAGRNDYQLIYICEGQCVVTLDGTVQIAYPGDCILYRPGEAQDYLLAKKVKPHTYWIHFNGEVCQKLFETLLLQNVHIIKAEQNREVEHLVSRVCQYYNLEVPNRELICSGMMQTILALLSNELYKGNPHTGEKGKDKVSEVISHIKMVPNLNITVSECADFCKMSKVHFSRFFKQITGMPPIQFVLKIRIDRAKELLDFTDKSIAEIAEASGFPDQNYFARTFKKITGMSPTQYRNVGNRI